MYILAIILDNMKHFKLYDRDQVHQQLVFCLKQSSLKINLYKRLNQSIYFSNDAVTTLYGVILVTVGHN